MSVHAKEKPRKTLCGLKVTKTVEAVLWFGGPVGKVTCNKCARVILKSMGISLRRDRQ